LRAAGARLVRHAHDMELDLATTGSAGVGVGPALPEGLTLSADVALVPALVRARLAAYPPGHPDAGPSGRSADEVEQDLINLLAGSAAGPVLQDASATVMDAAGMVVAAAIITRLGPEAWGWPGGPWVADVLVVPAWQGHGLGRALLTRAIAHCRAAGEARIGLTVTEGNPAQRLYASLGFQQVRTLFVLDTEPLPPE
jgi:GNAT superfamily N-acetyltransferase